MFTFMKREIMNLKISKKTKVILSILACMVGILVVFISFYERIFVTEMNESAPPMIVLESSQSNEKSDIAETLNISINLAEHFRRFVRT